LDFEIPNYRLLKRLGEGAMAEVWLGEHKRNERKAAIKILKPAALSDADAERLFLREGQVLAGFRDDNIVAIYDNDRIGDFAYIVMELLPGGTLLERMQRGPISVGEAIGLIVQIAKALGTAHRAQVIHRDLKPANIMLRDETTPVLTDFGAVRMLDRSTIYGKDGGVIGTPIYMSPEQITGQPLDGRSDLYALGVLFHELLTGRLPFPGGSVSEIATQHLFAPIPRLPEELAVLQPILNRLLAKQSDDRYPSAQEFIDALRNCFLNEVALRRQVGFSGTGAAWSSQLRALGFVLDTQQKSAVRVAQGEYLNATTPTPPRVVEPPVERPVVAPTPPVPPAPAVATTSASIPVTQTKSRHGWTITVVVVAVGVGMGMVLAWDKYGAAPGATPAPIAATPAQKQRSADAEAAFKREYDEFEKFAQSEGVMKPVDPVYGQDPGEEPVAGVFTLYTAGSVARNQGDFATAESQFNAARTELKGVRTRLIDDRIAELAKAAEQALTQGKLKDADAYLAHAKALRALKSSS
jgi:hypothetical protein